MGLGAVTTNETTAGPVRSLRTSPIATLLAWAYLATAAGLAVWVGLASLAASWHPHLVSGGSMAPDLRSGDVVLVARPQPADLAAGNVIVFRDGPRSVVHRIVAVEADGDLVTRGDANRDNDVAAVRPEQVTGVGRMVVPLVGLPVLWLQRGEVVLLTLWALVTAAAVAAAWPASRAAGDRER